MNFNFSNVEELLRNAEDKKYYKKLLLQLQKDFALANINVGNFETLKPKELQPFIREKIYRLLLEKFDEYMQLLYVIDVPESAIKNAPMTDAVEVADYMTFLILKREFQKVYFKAKYAS